MECIATTSDAQPDYLSALWCVVTSQFWQTYTKPALCIGIAVVLYRLLRGRLGLNKTGEHAISVEGAIQSAITFAVGFGIYIAFFAPYDLYTEMANANHKLTVENRKLGDARKRELLEQLTVYRGVGRGFETQMQSTGGLSEMDKVRIKNWEEEVRIAIAGSPYKDRLGLLIEPAGVPRSTPPITKQPGLFTIWKSVHIINYRIQELIDYIQSHDN